MISLTIPHLAVIFVFTVMKVLLQSISILHLAAIFVRDNLSILCLVYTFPFPYLCQ